MKAWQAALLAMLLLPALAASRGPVAPARPGTVRSMLTAPGRFGLDGADDCVDARDAWARGAIRAMESRLAVARDRILDPPECYEPHEDSGPPFPLLGCGGGSASSGRSYDGGEPVNPGDGASQYTTTNVQVQGVDEADFVKNDGGHIYQLSGRALHVVDAWPPQEARVVGRLPLDGDPLAFFLRGDRAVIFLSVDDPAYAHWHGCDFEWSYGCDPVAGDGRATRVVEVDLADLERPVITREISVPASYVASRRIGDAVFVVLYTEAAGLPGSRPDIATLPVVPDALQSYQGRCAGEDLPYDADEVDAAFEALRRRNVEEIGRLSSGWTIPAWTDRRIGPAGSATLETPLLSCGGLLVPSVGGSADIVTVLGFDLSREEDVRRVSLLSGPGVVYASSDALYLATPHRREQSWSWYGEMGDDQGEATTVHRLALEPGTASARYSGSGIAKGRVLNQFSLDEHEGALRVATTTGTLPDPGVHSTVSVLRPAPDGRLETVGVVDRIAPGEDIRAVRFLGDLGYVVTFKKTDPLFTLDLSDPARPGIVGELKIPGFSTYLHRMDDGHLLSIGYDAEDQGSFAWFTGLLLQVFDVSDPARPALLHREVIGTRGSTSDATASHLAFTWFAERGLLAIPVAVCEGGGGGVAGDRMTFDGLMLYRVDLAEGFRYLGGIPRPASPGSSASSCGNWWTDPDSAVKRSLFLDDYAWAVTGDALRCARVDAPSVPVATIVLQ